MRLLRSVSASRTTSWLTHEPNGFAREADARLAANLPLRAWDGVLILGSGDGWLAEEAWRRLTRGFVCGLDRSEANAERTDRLRGIPGRLRFLTWKGVEIPFPGGCFDHVISRYALGMVGRPSGLLREVARVLRPDGNLYLLEAVAGPIPASRTCALLNEVGLFEASTEIRLFDDVGSDSSPHGDCAVVALRARRTTADLLPPTTPSGPRAGPRTGTTAGRS